jgi:hypothetical protein
VKAAGDRVFYKDEKQVYRVSELERFAWLELGFGTRLSEGWPPEPAVRLRQIHSTICLCADDAAGFEGTGDALISNTPGRYLSVRTADCIPILMMDERCKAIAAVHAGWRGAADGIVARTVDALAARYSSRPSAAGATPWERRWLPDSRPGSRTEQIWTVPLPSTWPRPTAVSWRLLAFRSAGFAWAHRVLPATMLSWSSTPTGAAAGNLEG